ncbi:hypothetical protein, partial [uncultured Albimonas sp.]|uniref:hypothetical protein n=1 Tax=uncultured Albimonas sp. TaxID=1331701 RepID=UPI0030ECB825
RAAMQAWTGGEGGVAGGGIEPAACDLSFPAVAERLEGLVEGACAVVHAAARLAGGDVEQARDTLGPTRAVCAAMRARAPRALLVLVSSFSVYDLAAVRASGLALDEASPLEGAPEGRDAYTRAKLGQEAIARASGLPLRILRPAYVYRPGRLDCAHLGVRKGPLELAMGEGPIAAIPVGACAEALALAALAPAPAVPEALNVVDADAPDRARWRAAMPEGSGAKLTLPLPPAALRAAAGALGALGQGHRAPGLLRAPVYAARFQGVPVSDARLRAALGWRPRHGFEAVAGMPG